jgi:hypothetical protein
MRLIKLPVIVLVSMLVMVISWVVGNLAGNALTDSTPPAPEDTAQTAQWFFIVCAFNALLITVLIDATRKSPGIWRWLTLVSYVFVVQFLLPQMETFFFSSEIGIGKDQASSILISGCVVSLLTVTIAVLAYDKLFDVHPAKLSPSLKVNWRRLLPWALVLVIVGYPLLYLTFGHFIAWQNESLRTFYTGSPAMAPYSQQVADAFGNGIYLFQVLRSSIWLLASIPVVWMLRDNKWVQFLIVAVICSLLPTSLLFIPNPYMPADVAMTHFIETSTSNFVWGLLMVWAIRKGLFA